MSKPKPEFTLAAFEKDVRRIAKAHGVEPYQVTKLLYHNGSKTCSVKGEFTEWQYRKNQTSFQVLLNDIFKADMPRDPMAIRGGQIRNLEYNRMFRELGTEQYRAERFYDSLKRALKECPIKAISTKPNFKPSGKQERAVVAMFSDLHLGHNIDIEELETNQYSWQIAARRMAYCAKNIAYYKYDHRKEVECLYLNILGDVISGLIHADDANIDLMTNQMLGAARYIVQMIDYLLYFYPRIKVIVAPGNHDRLLTHTKGKGRATAQKWDGFTSMLFEMVQQAFRSNQQVEFVVPKTPFTFYHVFGLGHLAVHGDTFLFTGMPGRSVNVAALTAQLDRFNANRSEAERVAVLLAGHVHTSAHVSLDNGELFVNASLSGSDPYAQSIGFTNGRKLQWMIEETREHGVGDTRAIDCAAADTDSSLDSIIAPFDYSLILRKVTR